MLTGTQENEEIVARVAALDIGKAEVMCCVRVPDEDRPGRRLQEVQAYPAMIRSLLGLSDRLRCLGVTRVVMEATSDYWKPVFYLLEAAGFETWLVNAKDVKHLPGRPKTDPLTELPGGVPQVSGRMGILVATVADHDHRRRCAAGPVAAGGAATRVA
jgi:transposase